MPSLCHYITNRRLTTSNLTNDITSFFFFFFNDTATTEIYTLSLHDALPIFDFDLRKAITCPPGQVPACTLKPAMRLVDNRSEEHTSELQSQSNLVCRLLLEKKKHNNHGSHSHNESASPDHVCSLPIRAYA